jgi:hypothetical protein
MLKNVDRFARSVHRSLKPGDVVTSGLRGSRRTRYVVLAFPGDRSMRHCATVRELATGRVFPLAQHWIASVNGCEVER